MRKNPFKYKNVIIEPFYDSTVNSAFGKNLNLVFLNGSLYYVGSNDVGSTILNKNNYAADMINFCYDNCYDNILKVLLCVHLE